MSDRDNNTKIFKPEIGTKKQLLNFLKWVSPNFIFLGLMMFIVAISAQNFAESHVPSDNLSFTFFVMVAVTIVGLPLTFAAFTVRALIIKVKIRSSLKNIEKITYELFVGNQNGKRVAPPDELFMSLNDLRSALSTLSKGAHNYQPLTGFHRSQLRREIDLVFSCITESIYAKYWTSRYDNKQLELKDLTEFGDVKFGYHHLNLFAKIIHHHMTADRKWFVPSNLGISTLKYRLNDWLFILNENSPEVVKFYRPKVEKHYDNLEAKARARIDIIVNITTSSFLALVAVVIGFIFGSK